MRSSLVSVGCPVSPQSPVPTNSTRARHIGNYVQCPQDRFRVLGCVVYHAQLFNDHRPPTPERVWYSHLNIAGMAHLAGVPGFELKGDIGAPDNLWWSKLWEGSGNGATALVTGFYDVIWFSLSWPMVLALEESQVVHRLW